jgi:hypothetical protein
MSKKFYVVFQEGKWYVKEDGKQTPLASYPLKDEALKRATAEAMMQEAELVIEHEKGKSEVKKFTNHPTV